MLVDIKVEKLRTADKQQLIELYLRAFQGHPIIPGLQGESAMAERGMDLFLSCFGGTDSSMAYGIRKDGRVICAALCLDAGAQPPWVDLMQLVFFISSTAGWNTVQAFKIIAKEEPKYEENYLEIMIFGTLPEYQKQGFGRGVLQYLYEEAKKQGYKGLTLLADRGTPACELYLKEGFIMDREFTVESEDLCWMRREFE